MPIGGNLLGQAINFGLLLNFIDNGAVKGIEQVDKKLGQLKKTTQETSSTLDKFGSFFDGMTKVSKTAALAGGAITGALTAPAYQAMEFEKQMARVATQIEDMNLQQVKDTFNKAIFDLSEKTGQGANIIAEAMFEGLSSGVAPEQILDWLNVAADVAIAGGTDVVTAIGSLKTAMDAYGKTLDDIPDLEQLTEISDSFFQGVLAARGTYEQMAAAMGGTLAVANTLGVSLDEIMASYAVLTQYKSAGEAFTGIEAIFSAVIQQGEQFGKALEQIGLTTGDVYESLKTKGISGFIDLIREGIDAYIGTAEEAANDPEIAAARTELLGNLFGRKEAIQSFIQLSESGYDQLLNNLDLAENKTGATGKAFEKMASSTGSQFSQVMEQFKNFTLLLGDQLLPVLSDVLTTVSNIVKPIIDWANENKELSGTILRLISWVGIFLLSFGGVGLTIGKLGSGVVELVKNFDGLKKTFETVTKAFTANPYLLVAVGIAAAAYLIWKNWDRVKAGLLWIWDRLKMVFEAWLNFFGLSTEDLIRIWSKITFYWGVIKDVLEQLWEWLKDLFAAFQESSRQKVELLIAAWNKIVEAWDWIKGKLEPVWNFLKALFSAFARSGEQKAQVLVSWWKGLVYVWETYIKPALEAVWGVIKDIYETFVNNLKATWDGLKAAWEAIVNFWETYIQPPLETAWNAIKTVAETVTGAITKAWDGLKTIWDAVKTPVDDLVSAFETLFGWIGKAWDKLTGFLGWFKNLNPLNWFKNDENYVAAGLSADPGMVKDITPEERDLIGARIEQLRSSLFSPDVMAMGDEYARNMVEGMAEGLSDEGKTLYYSLLEQIQGMDRLLPHSPAKEGPLRNLDKVGPAIIESIARGMSGDALKNKLSEILGLGFGGQLGLAGAGGINVTQYITIEAQIKDDLDLQTVGRKIADYSRMEIDRHNRRDFGVE